MSDSLEQDLPRRNDCPTPHRTVGSSAFGARHQEIHDPRVRQIPDTEPSEPFRASKSWRAVTMARQISVALVVFALALGLTGPVAPTSAAEQFVRVDGLVQWIGGQQMIVQADSGPSVDVDLASVRQDEYAGLGVRDRVAVIGMVSPDGRRLIGTSIVKSPRAR
jgi:hypothetical protein